MLSLNINKRSMKKLISKKGFTLIELLVVIGIIAILAAIAIIAINPARQFAQARNAQRWNDVNALLNAVHQQAVDNNGQIYADIDSTRQMIGTSGANDCDVTCADSVVTEAACLDLTDALVPKYVTSIPYDPSDPYAAAITGYYVTKNASTGRVTVGACTPEKIDEVAPDISVSR